MRRSTSRTRPRLSRSPKSAAKRCQPCRPRRCTWLSERLQPRFRSTRTRSRGPQRRTVRRWWSRPGPVRPAGRSPRGDVRDGRARGGLVEVDVWVGHPMLAARSLQLAVTKSMALSRADVLEVVQHGVSSRDPRKSVQFHATVTSVLFHPDVVAAREVVVVASSSPHCT